MTKIRFSNKAELNLTERILKANDFFELGVTCFIGCVTCSGVSGKFDSLLSGYHTLLYMFTSQVYIQTTAVTEWLYRVSDHI